MGISDNSQDALLNYYISSSTNYFLSETNLKEVPVTAQNIIIDLSILQFNKRGSEGLNSENMGGISYEWSQSLSNTIKAQLAKYRCISW